MSWYSDSDEKIITDEEFQEECCECSAVCSEWTISVPCKGEKTDCTHFKKIDTSDYDKKIRDKAIEKFAEKLCKDRVSNDPIVIAVKVLLDEMKEK